MKKTVKTVCFLLCTAICIAVFSSCSLAKKQSSGADTQTSSGETTDAQTTVADTDAKPDNTTADESTDGTKDTQSTDVTQGTVQIGGVEKDVSLQIGDESAQVVIDGEEGSAEVVEYPELISDAERVFEKASFDDLNGDGIGDLVLIFRQGDRMRAMAFLKNAENGEYEYYPELSQ